MAEREQMDVPSSAVHSAVQFQTDELHVSTSTSSHDTQQHPLADSSSAASSSFPAAGMGRYDETNQLLRLEIISDRDARVRMC